MPDVQSTAAMKLGSSIETNVFCLSQANAAKAKMESLLPVISSSGSVL